MARHGQKKQRIGYFRLDEKTWRRLVREAKRADRPVSWVVREAIRAYLDERSRAA